MPLPQEAHPPPVLPDVRHAPVLARGRQERQGHRRHQPALHPGDGPDEAARAARRRQVALMSDISGPDLTPLFWLAGCLLLGAILVVAVLVFALRRRATQPPREPPPGDDSRWSPESAPQRVGRACATCSKVFVTDRDV